MRDSSLANEAIIRSGRGIIAGSNPVGTDSLTHKELAYLVLDFSMAPVDYVGFHDIDQAGTAVRVFLVGVVMETTSLDVTGGSDGGGFATHDATFRSTSPERRFSNRL